MDEVLGECTKEGWKGSKGKVVLLSATDKPVLQRSLSAYSASSPTKSIMPVDNKPSNTLDAAFVEKCVNNYLSGGEGLRAVFAKLTEEVKSAVESAVTNALANVQNVGDRSDKLEQYQRRNNIRIFGVEEKTAEAQTSL
ncbi:hypothetical protein J6590_037657 [Homalodisca vitripennis]|nr:hypothetical protein J6590_037657 [Homalodisca vitripennis]